MPETGPAKPPSCPQGKAHCDARQALPAGQASSRQTASRAARKASEAGSADANERRPEGREVRIAGNAGGDGMTHTRCTRVRAGYGGWCLERFWRSPCAPQAVLEPPPQPKSRRKRRGKWSPPRVRRISRRSSRRFSDCHFRGKRNLHPFPSNDGRHRNPEDWQHPPEAGSRKRGSRSAERRRGSGTQVTGAGIEFRYYDDRLLLQRLRRSRDPPSRFPLPPRKTDRIRTLRPITRK